MERSENVGTEGPSYRAELKCGDYNLFRDGGVQRGVTLARIAVEVDGGGEIRQPMPSLASRANCVSVNRRRKAVCTGAGA